MSPVLTGKPGKGAACWTLTGGVKGRGSDAVEDVVVSLDGLNVREKVGEGIGGESMGVVGVEVG